MFSESFGTQNTMVEFMFRSDPRKGQHYVKLGQISKIKIFFKNMPILSSFILGFQKCYLFLRTAIRNAENCISIIVTSSPSPVFYHCMAKNEDIALTFGMCVVCVLFYNILFVF